MSTLAYAALTTKREEATPGTSESGSAPGVRFYVDAMAALVPAEVLTLHGLILSVTTSTDNGRTSITDAGTLFYAFFGLIVLSVVLYVVPRIPEWGSLDYLRAIIPPISFVAWTMLQRSTAFDAVAPQFAMSARTVVALFVAAGVGFLAARLAVGADRKKPAT